MHILILMLFWAIPQKGLSDDQKQVLSDSLGRQVVIPSRVDRIACMYAFTGHVVAMLGKADHIVAVSNGLKRDVLLSEIYPAFQDAVVPKFQGAINIEELTGARPDIVFVQSQTGRNSALAGKLDACGLTWIAVDFNTMAEQRKVITLIGRAIGAVDKAALYNTYYTHCIDRVTQIVSHIPRQRRPRIYHATVEPFRTSSGKSLPADWIHAAGAIHVATQNNTLKLTESHQVSMEQILLWHPDIILANEPGVVDIIKKSPKWDSLNAVKHNCVYQLPIGISRWGHPGSLETPLAILWAAKTIYPEKFRHIDMENEIKQFYKTFFKYPLSDKMVKQMLNGKSMRLNKNRKALRIKT